MPLFLGDRMHYKRALELLNLGDIAGAIEHLNEISSPQRKGELLLKMVEEILNEDIPTAVEVLRKARKLGVGDEYLEKAKILISSALVRTATFPKKAYVGVPITVTLRIPVFEIVKEPVKENEEKETLGETKVRGASMHDAGQEATSELLFTPQEIIETMEKLGDIPTSPEESGTEQTPEASLEYLQKTRGWAKTYGSGEARGVEVDKNGDIIIAGEKEGNGFVARLDRGGNVLWFKTYGGDEYDEFNDVKIATNGDIIVAGRTKSFGLGDEKYPNVWILRLDGNGNVKWERIFGGEYDDDASAVVIAPNGDIIVAGYTDRFGTGYGDAWILRLDENGNVKWQKTYGGPYLDITTGVTVTPNGDIIVTGWTESLDAGDGDAWILRLDENGNVKWQKTYGGSDWDKANAVAVTPEGDIIVIGGTSSFGAGSKDVWVLRLDENGNVKWQKTYGGSEDDEAYAVAIAQNGDIIVAGETDSFGPDSYNAWILRLDENGNVKWQKTYTVSDIHNANDVAIAPNGDIIVAGSYVTPWDENGDEEKETWENENIWVLRLPPDGELPGISRDSSCEVHDTNCKVSQSLVEVRKLKEFTGEAGIELFEETQEASKKETQETYPEGVALELSEEKSKKGPLPEELVEPVSLKEFETETYKGEFTASPEYLQKTRGWAKTYGPGVATAVALAENGDIIIAGYEGREDKENGFVARLDKNGSVKWFKIYGGRKVEKLWDVKIASNGDIIVAGETNSFGIGEKDVWVLRLDSEGNIKWQKAYGGSENDEAYAVAIAQNGDIIVAGCTDSFGDTRSAWILRLDANGNVKWQKTYGGGSDDEARAVAVAENGDIILAGWTKSFGAGKSDIWILRTDAEGNIKWQKTYGGSSEEWANAIAIAENGDIIVVGSTLSFSTGYHRNFWILRLDANGNVKWQKICNGSSHTEATSIAVTPNGDIIVIGYTERLDSSNYSWIVKLDEKGNVKWQKTFKKIKNSKAYAVVVDNDLVQYVQVAKKKSEVFGMPIYTSVTEIDSNEKSKKAWAYVISELNEEELIEEIMNTYEIIKDSEKYDNLLDEIIELEVQPNYREYGKDVGTVLAYSDAISRLNNKKDKDWKVIKQITQKNKNFEKTFDEFVKGMIDGYNEAITNVEIEPIIVTGTYKNNNNTQIYIFHLPPDGELRGLSEDSNCRVMDTECSVSTSRAFVNKSWAWVKSTRVSPVTEKREPQTIVGE